MGLILSLTESDEDTSIADVNTSSTFSCTFRKAIDIVVDVKVQDCSAPPELLVYRTMHTPVQDADPASKDVAIPAWRKVWYAIDR